MSRQVQGVVLGLMLFAAGLRLWQLPTIPPGLWFDEAYNGMDVVMMDKTHTWPIFLTGNNGREALFHHLLWGATRVLGHSPYTLRLVPALLSLLTLALMYRYLLALFHDHALALLGLAGLVTSLWFLIMNRTAYRANLLPLFVLITHYLFWRGWQTQRYTYYALAGLTLGLAQYTYFSTRLLPLVFVLFLLTEAALQGVHTPQFKTGWLGLWLMAGVSMLVAAPMLWLFVTNPAATWGRVGSVAAPFTLTHTLAALRLFVDGQDPNWRHHLLGQGQFNALTLLGFWLGLFYALTHYRQSAYRLLGLSLGVMALPALLSDPPIHTLRLAGILPAYYGLMAVGLQQIWRRYGLRTPLAGGVIFLLLTGVPASYDYFYRWARHPEVSAAFETDIVELADKLIHTDNVVIPFYLYTHATMRYELADHFTETVIMPETVAQTLGQQPTTSVILPTHPEYDRTPLVWVWLFQGQAYVSALRRDVTLDQISLPPPTPIINAQQQVMAYHYSLNTAPLLAHFPSRLPQQTLAATWGHNLRLTHYEFTSPHTLNLAWQLLGDTTLPEKWFVQVVNAQNQAVAAHDWDSIGRKLYRWRDDNLVLEQYPLPQTVAAGLYFVRLGFFNPQTTQRLPVYNEARQPLGDEIILGTWRVGTPTYAPFTATWGQELELLGYQHSYTQGQALSLTLYWRGLKPISRDYTAFVQLLDAQNQVVAQVDRSPLAPLYPMSRWQAGDVMAEQFQLAPLPDVSNLRLVTGFYDLATGARLTVTPGSGDMLELPLKGE